MGEMTIYVRDEDEQLFEREKALTDEGSLSRVLAKALEDYVGRREAENQGMCEYVLTAGEPWFEHKMHIPA